MREFERLVNKEITRTGFSVYPIRRSIVNFLMEDSESSFLGGIEEEMTRVERKEGAREALEYQGVELVSLVDIDKLAESTTN